MALITDELAQGLIDRMACIERNLDDSAAGGTSYADRLTAGSPDDEVMLLDLLPGAHAVDLALVDGGYRTTLHSNLLNALVQHLQRPAESGETKTVYASLDAWLSARGWRVPIQFSSLAYRVLGAYLLAANVYDDVKSMGSFAISGAGEGTFTDGLALDTEHTGGNNLEAVCETTVTSCSLTVTCRKPDGTTEQKTITVVGAAGTTVAIGDTADIYTDLTAVAINSGGANGQTVTFRSKLDRAMSL